MHGNIHQTSEKKSEIMKYFFLPSQVLSTFTHQKIKQALWGTFTHCAKVPCGDQILPNFSNTVSADTLMGGVLWGRRERPE